MISSTLLSRVLRCPPLQQALSIASRNCSSTTKNSTNSIRVRFAPSPTGYLHLGGLRTVLYNHLLARKMGGKWILRIEDTDQARYVEGAVENLLETLKWAGMDFDEGPGREGKEGPYYQSQRKEIYDRYLQPLIDEGKAYHCFCSPTRLADVRKELQKAGAGTGYDRHCLSIDEREVKEKIQAGEKSIVRFKSSPEGMKQSDLVYDDITYDKLPIEDFVLRKSDGLPTYHFANVVDDHEMRITHVLRGEEWLASTPKHLSLYSALNFTPPLFAHMPLLINPDGSKLSKRAGDVKVDDYIEKGYESVALLNFVALMGWAPPPTTNSLKNVEASDVMTLEQMINLFSIEGINKSRATMSISKLDYLNRAHIQLRLGSGKQEDRLDLATRSRIILKAAFPHSETLELDYIGRVIFALKERLYTLKDIPNLGPYFFTPPDLTTKIALQLQSTVAPEVYQLALESTISAISALPSTAFETDLSEEILDALNSLKLVDDRLIGKNLMNPLRHALTGLKVGAGMSATIAILGREESKKRMLVALTKMK